MKFFKATFELQSHNFSYSIFQMEQESTGKLESIFVDLNILAFMRNASKATIYCLFSFSYVTYIGLFCPLEYIGDVIDRNICLINTISTLKISRIIQRYHPSLAVKPWSSKVIRADCLPVTTLAHPGRERNGKAWSLDISKETSRRLHISGCPREHRIPGTWRRVVGGKANHCHKDIDQSNVWSPFMSAGKNLALIKLVPEWSPRGFSELEWDIGWEIKRNKELKCYQTSSGYKQWTKQDCQGLKFIGCWSPRGREGMKRDQSANVNTEAYPDK